jgi:amidase
MSETPTGRFFVDYDVLLTPTLATPPPEIGELAPTAGEQAQLRLLGRIGSAKLIKAAGLLDQMAKGAFKFTPWTPIYNVTGQPAMSVPLHWTETGLPIGVHFAARFGDEATLLRLAGQLERARPWFDTLPELATTRVSTR